MKHNWTVWNEVRGCSNTEHRRHLWPLKKNPCNQHPCQLTPQLFVILFSRQQTLTDLKKLLFWGLVWMLCCGESVVRAPGMSPTLCRRAWLRFCPCVTDSGIETSLMVQSSDSVTALGCCIQVVLSYALWWFYSTIHCCCVDMTLGDKVCCQLKFRILFFVTWYKRLCMALMYKMSFSLNNVSSTWIDYSSCIIHFLCHS